MNLGSKKIILLALLFGTILFCLLFVPTYTTSAKTYCTDPKPPIRKSILRGDSKQSIKNEIENVEAKASNDPKLYLKNCVSTDQKYQLYLL
jgi:hypothetical protein